MREIKFRAWDHFNEIMWGQEECYQEDLATFFKEYQMALEGGNNPILMQYTGLKDKNGTEIYEGDYLESLETHMIYQIESIVPVSRMTNFECSTPIALRTEDGIMRGNGIYENYSDDWMSMSQFYKVIGNIHENPELLTN